MRNILNATLKDVAVQRLYGITKKMDCLISINKKCLTAVLFIVTFNIIGIKQHNS